VKHLIRFCAVLLFAACVCLSGCDKGENPNVEDTFVPTEITLVENGTTAYTIVYAKDDVVDYKSIAEDVQRQIQKYMGVKPEIVMCGADQMPAENCILIGPTTFAESASAVEGLRFHDYVLRTDGTHLVFGVLGAKGASNAMDILIDRIAAYDKTSEESFRLSLNERGLFDGYSFNTFTVDGTPLKDFAIVYGKSSTEAAAVALQQELMENYGYRLPVSRDMDTDPAAHEILVGFTRREASGKVEEPTDALSYTWAVVDGNLVLKTAGAHSLDRAAETASNAFSSLGKDVALENGYTAEGSVHKPPIKDGTLSEGADVRVMSSNVLADLYVTDREALPFVTDRSEMYFAALEYYQPAVIGVQEFDKSWWSEWNNYAHKDQYKVITANNPNIKGEKYLTAIIYRTDLLEMEEGDIVHYTKYNNYRGRVMNWGLFKVKETGERFIFLNTHWDVNAYDEDGNVAQLGYRADQSKEVRDMVLKLRDEYGLPVICTGDWNLWEKDQIMVSMLKKTDMVNARQVLYPGYGRYIDMILTDKDVSVLRWEELAYNSKPDLGSDHAWLIADLKFPD
jgi:hypothetical protein